MMARYMEPTEDEIYVNWLYRMVDEERPTWYVSDIFYVQAGYSRLMDALYNTEFTPLVDFDQNRAADGVALRRRFCVETGYRPSKAFMDAPCSMLEMIIGISSRMAFNMDASLESIFWHLITNLDLRSENDEYFNEPRVNEILETLNNRTYDELGNGGLFPLKESSRDQRQIEIMFQMYEYVNETYNS